jgi:hypothetical protein
MNRKIKRRKYNSTIVPKDVQDVEVEIERTITK